MKRSGLFLFVAVMVAGAAGCSAMGALGWTTNPKIHLSQPEQVIIEHSMGSPENTWPTADAECKRHNAKSTAVFQKMEKGAMSNLFIFSCVKK